MISSIMVLPVGTGVYLIPTVMFLVTSNCGSLVYIIYTCRQLFPCAHPNILVGTDVEGSHVGRTTQRQED